MLHLLYARFWHKVLFDLGHVSSSEPFRKLFNQGYIQAYAYKDGRGMYVLAEDVVERDGRFYLGDLRVNREYGKIGKSLKNVVTPGRDVRALRRRHVPGVRDVDGSAGRLPPWDTRAVVGSYRFLQRVWRLVVDEQTGCTPRWDSCCRR